MHSPVQVGGTSVKLGIPPELGEMMKTLIPLGRVGTPQEAAGSILMLASPLASYISGQAIEVTGGGWM